MEREQGNNESEDKAFDKNTGDTEPEITQGYETDTELEKLLKEDLTNIDTVTGEDQENRALDTGINSEKDMGKLSMSGKLKNLYDKAAGRLKIAWNSYVDMSGRNFIIPVLFMDGNNGLS
jgi:hypothetical protein